MNYVKQEEYFEGWYFKQQTNDRSIAFIPAYHIDNHGELTASIQVITDDFSHNFTYSSKEFSLDRDNFVIQIGNSVFTRESCQIDLKTAGLSIIGELVYGPLSPLSSPIMGPFRHLPNMECNHDVLSLWHHVNGILVINGTSVLYNGIGYIESDRGSSFPQSYFWTQCMWPGPNNKTSIMVSVADIPYLGMNFRGCISSIWQNGKEYRLATYLGAKVLLCHKQQVLIQQNNLLLQITMIATNPNHLLAPQKGQMSLTIDEHLACQIRYQLFCGSHLLLDHSNNRASFEFVEDQNSKRINRSASTR